MIHPLLTLHTRARSLGVLAAALTACGGAPGDAGAGPASPGVAIAISAVTPPAGPSAGATPVTVEGTGFEAGVRVRFGGVEAAQVSVAGPTRLVAVAPAHAPGQVDVEVIDANLQTATLAGGFTYLQAPPPSPTAPAVAGVAPASGPVSGNTVVTLTGTGFVTGSTVTIGGTAAIMGAVTATRITVTTPGGPAGPANVTVTNPDRQSTTLVGGFTYLAAPPVVTAINVRGSPQAGGGLMLLVGSGLESAAYVTFGGAAATGLTHDPASGGLIVTIPPSPLGPTADGFVDIVVTNLDGQSAASPGFHYGNRPGASSFTPTLGPNGSTVVIGGADFSADTTGARAGLQVSFGGTLATLTQRSPTQITVTVPKLNPGAYPVVVTNFDGQYSVAPGAFTVPGP